MENQEVIKEVVEKFEKDWHFASKEDESLKVETAIYKNGNQVKRVPLSDGRIATLRELLGSDMMKVDTMLAAGRDQEKYFPIMMHFAAKIDGFTLPIEDFENMKGKDYNQIKIQVMSLNF